MEMLTTQIVNGETRTFKREEKKKVKISRCDRHSVSVQSSFKSLTCVTCASTSAAR